MDNDEVVHSVRSTVGRLSEHGRTLPGVRIDLTVTAGATRRDVAVLTPRPVALARVAPTIAACVGAGSGASMWAGTRRLGATAVLGEPGLRNGDEVSVGRPGRDRRRTAARTVSFVAGSHAGAQIPLYRERLVIGRDPDCAIVLDDDRVSRRHAEVCTSGPIVTLRDLGSTNGTLVEGKACDGDGVALDAVALARVGDCLLRIDANSETPAGTHVAGGALVLSRAPRDPVRPTPPAIRVPSGPQHSRPRREQWITALLPAVAGGLIAWLADSPQFLLFALLSPVMLLSTSVGDRVHWRRTQRAEGVTRRAAAAAARTRIDDALRDETQSRRTALPDPPTVLRIASTPGRRLWERRRTDPDLLRVRLGSADRPARVQIHEGSELHSAGTLHAVPVEVDLRAGALGLTGPAEMARGLARWVTAQLATAQSPDDLEIHLLVSPDSATSWRWARWLPHVRAVATDPQAWATTIAALATRTPSTAATSPPSWPGRWAVVVGDLGDSGAVVPGVDAVLADGVRHGVTALWVAADPASLPSACRAVADVDDPSGTRLKLRVADGVSADSTGEALVERVSEAWADEVARALAPLVDGDAHGDAAVPARSGRFETFGVRADDPVAVAESWSRSDGGAGTAIGRTAEGPMHIDLAKQGPHLLVAGTTGAGKSELLRTLVAGLAVAHPPDELSFLLVDYKGGAAFAECADLPHTTGVVTDLDEGLTQRALRSLQAELRRRERLLAAVGAVDLTAYRRSRPAEAVARLVIVVDEFATLVDELPDFVPGLVGVAQRGRSLGVHLVLATQRPGSAVSADIRANTSLRIALRVTDVGESIDILDAPDAAGIDASAPGRAYLRAGRRLTCFQTAHDTDSPDADGPSVQPLDDWRRPMAVRPSGRPELVPLVAAVQAAASRSGRRSARPAWLPPLTELVRSARPRPALDGATRRDVCVGLVDLPDAQSQPELTVRVCDGESVLIAGRSGSGRTNALLTLALGALNARRPGELEVYVVDTEPGGLARQLGTSVHVATSIGPGEVALLPTLLARLQVTRSDAHRLLLVDGWDRLGAGATDLDAARLQDALLALLRRRGLTVAVTGDRSLLAARFASHFTQRLLLALVDANDYALCGVPGHPTPESWPPGRGVRLDDGASFQLAHAADDDVRATLAATDAARPSRAAIRLRPLPQRVSLRVVQDSSAGGCDFVLGVAGDEPAPCHADLVAHRGRLLVAGAPRSGRSTALGTLLREALRLGVTAVVAAPARSPLAVLARECNVHLLRPSDPADALGDPPVEPTLLLVDDSETFVDSALGDRLTHWARAVDAPLCVVVAGRCDDLATSYRGVAAEVRRNRCGVLLRPASVDGDLLGVRLPRPAPGDPPGRGIIVGDPAWGGPFAAGDPLPVQLAVSDALPS